VREERGTLKGNQVISESVDLWGTVVGNVSVVDGGKVYVRGAIYGTLTVYMGGRVHIYGNVSGNLHVEEGAKVIHSGVLGGDAVNNGGRLYIEANSKVMGRVKTKDGETKIDAKATVRA
jgi:cytoskeletal protein CcmA (bactofilin family)